MSENRANGSRENSHVRSRNNQTETNNSWLIVGGAIVIILVVLIIAVNLKKKGGSAETVIASSQAAAIETETFDDSKLKSSCDIDLGMIPGLEGKTIHVQKGMNRTEILKLIQNEYKWDVQAINQNAVEGTVVKPTVDANETTAVGSGDTETEGTADSEEIAAFKEIVVQNSIAMEDYILKCAVELLDKIFEDDRSSKSSQEINIYQLKFDGLDEAIERFAQDADDMWYVEAKGGSIESYDKEKDEFLMEGNSEGCKIDKEKLIADLSKQLKRGNFQCKVPVTTESISAEGSVLNGEYSIIAEYVTHTTSNSVRNTNVRLACEKLNGTIVRPGEEFSYNYTIGERTAEKGYGTAAAYSNGEVVQEIGGGVCQVSSTLYNAITQAGLKTTYRSPHTFKPTYVTPGQDATVSWNGPDYRFANVVALPDISFDTTYAIGIRAVYKDQTVTVSIFGRPVLKPGIKVVMESEMTGEVEVVRETIPEGSDKEPTTGDKGSTWKTYLHITKDDQEISREVYHTTRYKGHTEYYYETLPESTDESAVTMPEEFGPGYVNSTSPADSVQPAVTSEATEATETTVSQPISPLTPETGEASSASEPSGTTPGAYVNDVPGGLPGIETQPAETADGPRIIIDGP